MPERRKALRNRTYFGGVIALGGRGPAEECIVRNLSDTGARVAFSSAAAMPDEINLTIARKQRAYRARLAWRTADDAGLIFLNEIANGVPVPLEWARRLRACEDENAGLRKRIAELAAPE